MVRYTPLILFALIIDLLQAGISAAFFALGAFPATAVGGAGGCFIGYQIAGKTGCYVLGAVVGVIGSSANPVLVGATMPIAIGFGFVINFCLDVTLGTILSVWLMSQGMYYPKYGIAGYIAELIPGLNDLPGWTLMTVLSVVKKSAQEKKLKGGAQGMFTTMTTSGFVGAGVSAVTAIKQKNMEAARNAGVFTQEQQTESNEYQKNRIVGSELKNIDGIRVRTTSTPSNDNSPGEYLQHAAA